MFKPYFCLFILFIFSISVIPVIQIISFLHQEEMVDDISEEEISLIKIGNEADNLIYCHHPYEIITVVLDINHLSAVEQLNSRLFNDIITPPPDVYNFLG